MADEKHALAAAAAQPALKFVLLRFDNDTELLEAELCQHLVGFSCPKANFAPLAAALERAEIPALPLDRVHRPGNRLAVHFHRSGA